MELAAVIGRRIKALREEKGLTQEKLAYECDAISSKGYLSDIESGNRIPSVRALQGIADRLGVEVLDFLLDLEGSPRHRLVEASRHWSPTTIEAVLRDPGSLLDEWA
jgi:transcriptional regulator with XRE-family HTH domain